MLDALWTPGSFACFVHVRLHPPYDVHDTTEKEKKEKTKRIYHQVHDRLSSVLIAEVSLAVFFCMPGAWYEVLPCVLSLVCRSPQQKNSWF